MKWINPRTKLPDEDEPVLVAVCCEGEGCNDITQYWEEVHEGTIYRGGCDLIASADGCEYINDEILGWMPMPEPPKRKRAAA